MKAFTFENSANGTGDYRLGKLTQATAYGYTDGTVTASESYTYGGVGGAVSAKATSVQVSGGTLSGLSQSFGQAFTWNDLGQPADLTYPTCTGTLGCASTTGRKVYYGYTNGFLTSVGPYYATGIAYHPNGMTSAVTHGKRIVTTADGVVDETAISTTTYAPRPTSIATSGVTLAGSPANWTTGTYQYDAAGNVTAVGADTFGYDGVSRLDLRHRRRHPRVVLLRRPRQPLDPRRRSRDQPPHRRHVRRRGQPAPGTPR